MGLTPVCCVAHAWHSLILRLLLRALALLGVYELLTHTLPIAKPVAPPPRPIPSPIQVLQLAP